jgi:hypothetical protein
MCHDGDMNANPIAALQNGVAGLELRVSVLHNDSMGCAAGDSGGGHAASGASKHLQSVRPRRLDYAPFKAQA